MLTQRWSLKRRFGIICLMLRIPIMAAKRHSSSHWVLIARAALANALRELAQNADASAKLDSIHGQKYILDGRLRSPSGRSAVVRTIWIVDRGEDIPRLVTAYPHEE